MTAIPPNVTVFCDPTLGPAMRALDPLSRSRIGTPISVLSAPAPLMLEQITRRTRDDVLITLSGAMDQAIRQNLVKPGTRIDAWSTGLVLASRSGAAPAVTDEPSLLKLVASARIALTDPTTASADLDGFSVLKQNGLDSQLGARPNSRAMGAANTQDVAFLVTSGAADIGVVYLTDVRADPRLAVLAPLTTDPGLTRFSGAVNAKAVSPNAQTFLQFLTSTEARARLHDAGLEFQA